jgi:hypothetical protein
LSRGLLAVLLLALLAHGAGLRNGFVYDDHRFIGNNMRLATVGLRDVLLDVSTHTADADRDVWRPLRVLGHQLDLAAGLGPFAFHLHSLAAHLAAVALGWLLLRRLLPAPSEAPALLGATLLAVHPLGVEVVGWASSRGDEYALALGCAALLTAVQAGDAAGRRARAGWLAAAAALGFLALLGKESAVWVPLVALLGWRLLGRPRPWAALALGAGVAAALALRHAALSGLSPVQTTPHGGDVVTQAGWALFGTGLTLGHVAWPAGLSVDYVQDTWVEGVSPWLRPWSMLALAVVAAAIALRRRRPVAALLLGWALLAWLPSSSLLVTLRSLVNDRGAYPLLLPLGALLGLPLVGRPRLAAGATLAVATMLVPLSVARTLDFHDDGSLWAATARVQPLSVRAHLGLAQHAAAFDRQEQGRQLKEALSVARPGSLPEALALSALGDWTLRFEHQPEAALPLLERAARQLRAWRERPWPLSEEAPTAASLAEALTLVGRHGEGDQVLLAALHEHPHALALYVQRAGLALLCWEREHDAGALRIASEALRVAHEYAPNDPIVQGLMRRLALDLSELSPPPSGG